MLAEKLSRGEELGGGDRHRTLETSLSSLLESGDALPPAPQTQSCSGITQKTSVKVPSKTKSENAGKEAVCVLEVRGIRDAVWLTLLLTSLRKRESVLFHAWHFP